MKYNGQEVELITEGYWPEGVTLICGEYAITDVICLRAGRVITKVGTTALAGQWALLPTKPAPRRLTNREVAGLCRKGWDLLDGEWVYAHASYKKQYENDPAPQGMLLRAPGSDEWLEPTSDLLEVEA